MIGANPDDIVFDESLADTGTVDGDQYRQEDESRDKWRGRAP
jgi:hypothetical protein